MASTNNFNIKKITENIDDFFDGDRFRFPPHFWLIILGMISLILGGAYVAVGYDVSKFLKLFTPDAVKYWITVFVGIVSSIFATWFYEYSTAKKNVNKFAVIEKLANRGLWKNIFDDLHFYDNRYFDDYKVQAKLKKSTTNTNFFELVIDYSFKKVLKSNELIFEFIRITNEQQRTVVNDNYRNSIYLDYEFFLPVDETDLVSPIVADSSFYKISPNISLSSDNKVIYATLTRKEESNRILYSGVIPVDIFAIGSLVEYKFSANLCLEKDSYFDFVFDLPTNNIECIFDYEEVKNDIFIGGVYYLSSHRGPQPFNRGKDSEFVINKRGWFLPKSSLIFIWWKK